MIGAFTEAANEAHAQSLLEELEELPWQPGSYLNILHFAGRCPNHCGSVVRSLCWFAVSIEEIKAAIEQLPLERRAELAAWLHGWKDDEWDEQMKRDVAEGRLDDVVREVEDDIKAGRLRDMP